MQTFPRYDTNLFFFKNKAFIGEASELDSIAKLSSTIEIESSRTGAVKRFFLKETHHDVEGDITHWTFIPSDIGLRNSGIKVVVFND